MTDNTRGVAARVRSLRSHSGALHVALLLVGAAFLLVNAFNGYLWFDETYSVAIANHSFSDIWYIGSGDVHPVLFYWALHVLNMLFGENLTVYRLFTIAGVLATATLGLTHVRRDFGPRVGFLFSFLVLFTPYMAVIAVEIRMYTWAVFAVTLCALYAWRIVSVLRARDAAGMGRPTPLCRGIAARAAGMPAWAGAPRRWWLTFFLASLASAYLHYFGVMAAFMVNVLVLVYLCVRARRAGGSTGKKGCVPGEAAAQGGGARAHAAGRAGRAGVPAARRALCVYAVGAVLVVATFVPWLYVLLSQLGVVSGTYWAKVVLPTTFIEWLTYPLATSFISFAIRGSYGVGWQAVLVVAAVLTVLWFALLAACEAVRAARRRAARGVGVGAASTGGGERAAFSARRSAGSAAVTRADVAHGARPGRWARLRRWAARDEVAPVLCGVLVYAGVFTIGAVASLVMGQLIMYYRYLVVPIGPLLLAVALLLARVRWRPLLAAALALVLTVAVVNQSLLVIDDYDARNQVPLDAFESTVDRVTAENGGQTPLITSTDIGYMSLTAVAYPEVPQVYMDWQKGNWDRAYLAYAPTMTSKKSWELILDDFHGTFIVLGQAQHGTWPRDITDLSKKPGITVKESHTYFRPYERTWLTIAVMEKA